MVCSEFLYSIIFAWEYTGSMLLIFIFVLYTEGIQIQDNLYISNHLYLKTMTCFLGGVGVCSVKRLVSNAQMRSM